MDYDNSSSRRTAAACDRCRGQKLRCVGLASPVFKSSSRFQRNEIPCERCEKAGAECFSVRPAPRRRTAGSNSGHDKQSLGAQSYHDRSPLVAQYQRSSVRSLYTNQTNQAVVRSKSPPKHRQESNSANSRNGPQSYQQSRDIDTLSMIPTLSSEWVTTYLQDDNVDPNGLDLGTPIQMLDPDLNLCQGSVVDSLGDHSMIDLTTKATSAEWKADQIDIDTSLDQTGSTLASSETGRQSNPGQTTDSSIQEAHPAQRLVQSCIQELAKLNEVLLREKSSLEGAAIQKSLESGQLSIGQTLHHCQDFLSILRRLKSAFSNSDSNGSLTASEWSFVIENEELDNSTHLHPLPRQNTSKGTAQSHLHHGSSDSTSSGRSLPLTNAVPSLEIPALLSILSCYAYILQSYDNLLTPILDVVTRSTPTVPATLSGLCLDGFKLDGHNALQLECLINVSFNLLENMENILIGFPGHEGLLSQAGGGRVGDKLFAGLIDALYDQNKQNDLFQNKEREVRAKRLIREIQGALRVIDM